MRLPDPAHEWEYSLYTWRAATTPLVRALRPLGHAHALLGLRGFQEDPTAFGLPSFKSVPVWIFLQLLFEEALHALVRLADETVFSMARRRLIRRQACWNLYQHGIGM